MRRVFVDGKEVCGKPMKQGRICAAMPRHKGWCRSVESLEHRRTDPEYLERERERNFQRDNFDPQRRIYKMNWERERQLSG